MQKGLITDTFTPVLRDKFAKFPSEVIGQTNSGNDRLLYSGGSARYLERPAEDELQQLLKE